MAQSKRTSLLADKLNNLSVNLESDSSSQRNENAGRTESDSQLPSHIYDLLLKNVSKDEKLDPQELQVVIVLAI